MFWHVLYVYRTFITTFLCMMKSDFDINDSNIILMNRTKF